MPLTLARAGETVTIRKITGRDEVRRHLAELGFVSRVAGSLIVQIKDSRVALNRGMAARILV